MPKDAVLILCLWGYGKLNVLMLACRWFKLVISLIVLIFNASERSTHFAAHCAEVSINTVKSWQTSPGQTNPDKNFVKPEQTICQFCQAGKSFLKKIFKAGIPATAGKIAALPINNYQVLAASVQGTMKLILCMWREVKAEGNNPV